MDVFRRLEDVPAGAGTVATVGSFDGLHRGHAALLARLVQHAKRLQLPSTVVSFWPHPRLIVPGQDAPKLLQSLPERQAKLQQCGVDQLLLLDFTPEFMELSPEEYIRKVMVEALGVRLLVVGPDHRFGRNRAGGITDLRAAATHWGFELDEVDLHEVEAIKVGSSRIREALLQGRVEDANRLLGYSYTLQAEVVPGDRRGRQLGFPTANLQPLEPLKLVPANGVYAVWVHLADGSRHMGMLNTGVRPTVDGQRYSIEVHVLDFEGDLYGSLLHVEFVARLRPEQRFESLEALKQQLMADRENTRARLARQVST